MFWYTNVFCEIRKLCSENSKHSKCQWMLRATANTVVDGKREAASVSAESIRFYQSESVWHLLFHVGIFYSVFISLYSHICIFCSVVVGISLYRLLERCILYFKYRPKNGGGGGVLENNLLLNKKYSGSVCINPTYVFPLCSSFLQTPNHPSIPYQCGIILMGWGPQVTGNQHHLFLLFNTNGHGLIGDETGILWHHCQHGPAVGGGDNELLRERWNIDLIGQYGMGISEEPRWKMVQPGQRGDVPGRAIKTYRPWDCQGHYFSNSSYRSCHARY